MERPKNDPAAPTIEPPPADARDMHIEIANRIADLQRQRQQRRRQRGADGHGLTGRLLSVARFLFS